MILVASVLLLAGQGETTATNDTANSSETRIESLSDDTAMKTQEATEQEISALADNMAAASGFAEASPSEQSTLIGTNEAAISETSTVLPNQQETENAASMGEVAPAAIPSNLITPVVTEADVMLQTVSPSNNQQGQSASDTGIAGATPFGTPFTDDESDVAMAAPPQAVSDNIDHNAARGFPEDSAGTGLDTEFSTNGTETLPTPAVELFSAAAPSTFDGSGEGQGGDGEVVSTDNPSEGDRAVEHAPEASEEAQTKHSSSKSQSDSDTDTTWIWGLLLSGIVLLAISTGFWVYFNRRSVG
jgi:hypothetical protein